MTETTQQALVVVRPFGRYGKGDLITDKTTIAALSGGGNAASVLRVAVPASSSSEH